MAKYFSRAVIFINLFTGFLFYIIASLFWAHDWALWGALLFTVGMFLIVPAVLYWNDRRYRGIEEELAEPVLLKATVNFDCSAGIRNGYLYFTGTALYLYSRDKKPFLADRVEKVDVVMIQIRNHTQMYIFAAQDRSYLLNCAACGALVEQMLQHGWITKPE